MLGKQKGLFPLLILLFTLLSVSKALAAVPQPANWYADGNVGYSSIHQSYPANSRSSGPSWSMAVGYKFTTYLGAEVDFARFVNVNVAPTNGVSASITHYAYDIAGKAILPLWQSGFELFGKLGVGKLNADVNITGADNYGNLANKNYYATSLYLAAGTRYYVMPNLGLGIEWEHMTGDNQTGSTDLYTAGVTFLFG